MVLGDTTERYLFLSNSLYGWSWVGRPLVVLFAAITLVGVFWPFIRRLRGNEPAVGLPAPAAEVPRAG